MGLLDRLLGGGNLEAQIKELEQEIDSGTYEDADEKLMAARDALNKRKNPKPALAIRLDLLEGQLRWKYGQHDRAQAPLKRAYQAAGPAGEKELLRDAARLLLTAAQRAGRFKDVVDLAEQWMSIAPADILPRADMLQVKANALGQMGRYQDALVSYVASQRLVEALPETPEKSERLINASSGLGDAYLGLDDRANAINSWRHALSFTQRQMGEHHPQAAAILVCIGGVQMMEDHFDAAAASFNQALEIYRASHQAESMGACVTLQRLAMAQMMRKDYLRAELHAQEALRIASQHTSELVAQSQDLIRKIEFTRPVESKGAASQPQTPHETPTSKNPLAGGGRTAFRTGRSAIATAGWQSFAQPGR